MSSLALRRLPWQRALSRPNAAAGMVAMNNGSGSGNGIMRRMFGGTAGLRTDTPTVALPVRKPIGAFRGGLFGFLFGSTLAGGAMYYYVLEDYRVSNELLTEEIYALQAAVQRIQQHVRNLEEAVEESQRKKQR